MKESSFVFRAHLNLAGVVIKGRDNGNISNVAVMLEVCHLRCGEIVLIFTPLSRKKNSCVKIPSFSLNIVLNSITFSLNNNE